MKIAIGSDCHDHFEKLDKAIEIANENGCKHFLFAGDFVSPFGLASLEKFKGEVENYILDDIRNYSDTLVQKEFDKNAPKTFNQIKIDYNSQANQDFVNSNLGNLIGKGSVVTEIIKNIDTDNDGNIDKELTIKQDGTKVEEDIIIFID